MLLGAMVTVLMAAFMTSTQQAVGVAQRQLPAGAIAHLPRALQYSNPDTGAVAWDNFGGGNDRSKTCHGY